MKKNQIIGIVVAVVLIVGGVIGWVSIQKSKIPSGGEIIPGEEEKVEELFSLSGIVSSVDAQNNFLMVKPANQEKEVKVLVSDTTKMIKLELPFDPKNPPKEATFTPKQTEITISGIKAGDNVFIKTKTNMAGKTEFDDIDFIHILP